MSKYYSIRVGRLCQIYDDEKRVYTDRYEFHGDFYDSEYLKFLSISKAKQAVELSNSEYYIIEERLTEDKWNHPTVYSSPAVLEYETEEKRKEQAERDKLMVRVNELNSFPTVFSIGSFKDLVTGDTLHTTVKRDTAVIVKSSYGSPSIGCKLTLQLSRSKTAEVREIRYFGNYFTNTNQVRKGRFYNSYANYIGDHFIDEYIRAMKDIKTRYDIVEQHCCPQLKEPASEK